MTIDEKLRNYQRRIIENSKDQNTLVSLPTGSGKTWIAASIIAHVHERENDGRLKLLLVPKGLLVLQQAKVLETWFPHLKVSQYCKGKWQSRDNDNADVIVATPDGALKLFTSGDRNYSFNRCSLVVLDEVHHTIGNDPYVKVASAIAESSNAQQIQILGMTAMTTYENTEEGTKRKLGRLLSLLNIENIQTATPVELENDGFKPEVNTQLLQVGTKDGYYNWYRPTVVDDIEAARKRNGNDLNCYEEFKLRLEVGALHPWSIVLENLIRKTEEYVGIERTFLFESDRDGKIGRTLVGDNPYCEATLALTHLYEITRVIIKNFERDLELATYHWDMCEEPIKKLERIPELAEHYKKAEEHRKALGRDISKGESRLSVVIDQLVKNYDSKDGTVQALLFTKLKISVFILQHALEKPLGAMYNSGVLCGVGPVLSHKKITEDDHKETIKQFRDGTINLLISTTVAEEGLDVPESDFVIRYEPVQNAVGYIQGRGRARAQKSDQLVLGEHGGRSVKHFEKCEEIHREVLKTPVSELVKSGNSFTDTSSAQKLSSAVEYLAKRADDTTDKPQLLSAFCTKIGSHSDQPTTFDQSGWTCKILLTVADKPFSSEATCIGKRDAKRSAADKMIIQLLKEFKK